MADNANACDRREPPRWHIGQLAALAATTPRAVRLYHTSGLMPEPLRSDGGYRLYGPTDLATLLRIRRLRSLGFSLEQSRRILSLDEPASLGEALDGLRSELTARLQTLHTSIAALDRLTDEVQAGERDVDTLAAVLRAALATDGEPDESPLLDRLRQRLNDLQHDRRWPPLESRLQALRDAEEPSGSEIERLAAELSEVAPWELIPDDLVDAVLPTVLLGARFSPAQLAVLHRAAQLKRGGEARKKS